MPLQLKSKILLSISISIIGVSLSANVIQAINNTKYINFLEYKTKLPLGYINKGSPIPNWAAKKSVNTVAGIDLIGYLVKDENDKYNVVIEAADRREYFCGDYLDPLDPSFGNKYVPCKSYINH